MDKLRVFDASVYFGKGSMLFTSTDQEKFWDEEISFDVHEARGVDIPIGATVLPPVEVMDELFEIYYQVTVIILLNELNPLPITLLKHSNAHTLSIDVDSIIMCTYR
jgi:hypothetical protein